MGRSRNSRPQLTRDSLGSGAPPSDDYPRAARFNPSQQRMPGRAGRVSRPNHVCVGARAWDAAAQQARAAGGRCQVG